VRFWSFDQLDCQGGALHEYFPAASFRTQAGNVADVGEFSTALARITRMLDQNQIARETVTLVLDKGSAALASTLALEEARLGWISALPWNQAPAELRSRAVEELAVCSTAKPGVRAGAESPGARARVSLCGEVLGFLCRRAIAQCNDQSQPCAAEFAPRLAKELTKPQDPLGTGADRALVVGSLPG
jgi:hypothetical protein